VFSHSAYDWYTSRLLGPDIALDPRRLQNHFRAHLSENWLGLSGHPLSDRYRTTHNIWCWVRLKSHFLTGKDSTIMKKNYHTNRISIFSNLNFEMWMHLTFHCFYGFKIFVFFLYCLFLIPFSIWKWSLIGIQFIWTLAFYVWN